MTENDPAQRTGQGPHQRSSSYITKQEFVYRGLLESITAARLNPGERLLLDRIAGEYGVSRVPVREALLQLQAEGFVEMDPHMGARVVSVSSESFDDYFDFIEALNVLAVGAACTRHTTEDLTDLRNLLLAIETAASVGDLESYAELNMAFHAEIAYVSRIPLLPRVVQLLHQHWQRVMAYHGLRPSSVRAERAMKEHHDLLTAIEGRDPESAEQAMHRHSKSAREYYAHQMSCSGGKHLQQNGSEEQTQSSTRLGERP